MLRGLVLDIIEGRRRGLEVAASQKLESVGRLAAGVAHEINTPVQFVTDNVQFIRTSMTDIACGGGWPIAPCSTRWNRKANAT